MHFTPAVVLRHLISTALEPLSQSIHTSSDASAFLPVQLFPKGRFVGLVLLSEIGVCLNPPPMAVNLVMVRLRRDKVFSDCFALCHGKDMFHLVSPSSKKCKCVAQAPNLIDERCVNAFVTFSLICLVSTASKPVVSKTLCHRIV
jgi:hypothetical protein